MRQGLANRQVDAILLCRGCGTRAIGIRERTVCPGTDGNGLVRVLSDILCDAPRIGMLWPGGILWRQDLEARMDTNRFSRLAIAEPERLGVSRSDG